MQCYFRVFGEYTHTYPSYQKPTWWPTAFLISSRNTYHYVLVSAMWHNIYIQSLFVAHVLSLVIQSLKTFYDRFSLISHHKLPIQKNTIRSILYKLLYKGKNRRTGLWAVIWHKYINVQSLTIAIIFELILYINGYF